MADQKEVTKIALREKSHERPGLVEEMLLDLREALPGLFVDLSTSGRSWLRGKSAQEMAKAQQILSEVIDRIGRLKLDEREQEHRHAIENEQNRVDVQQKRMDLYLTSLERATRIVRELSEAGVDVDVTAILREMPIHISAIEVDAECVESAALAIESNEESK